MIRRFNSFYLFEGTCILCLDRSRRQTDLCLPCESMLPTLGNRCLRCAHPVPAGEDLCAPCLFNPPPFDATTAMFTYTSPIDRLITRFKEGERLNGRVLAEVLARKCLALGLQQQLDMLVPVPLSRARFDERGFNQARDIAVRIARELMIPLDTRTCVRVRDNPPQKSLRASERKNNLRGAFDVVGSVAGKHIGLVDDVITTTATVQSLTMELLLHDAAAVHVLALARTPSQRSSVLKSGVVEPMTHAEYGLGFDRSVP